MKNRGPLKDSRCNLYEYLYRIYPTRISKKTINPIFIISLLYIARLGFIIDNNRCPISLDFIIVYTYNYCMTKKSTRELYSFIVLDKTNYGSFA